MNSKPCKRKILVAEDTPIQAKKLCFYLERIGFDVVWVENGQLALNALDKEEFDLIISDVQMPIMDGLQLVKALRTHAKFSRLPIIVVTTLEEMDVKIEALKSGANDFLNKPYSIEELEIRAKNQIALYHYQRIIENENVHLNQELIVKNQELEKNFQELHATHEQMKKMQVDLIRVGKMNTLGMLGAGVAHEINNPLSIISGLNQKITRLIQAGSADVEALKKCTSNIDTNVKRITGIVQQLRRVSGRLDDKIFLSPLGVHKFIDDLEAIFKIILTNNEVELVKKYHSEEIFGYFNETNFSQTILNLLQNASDAMGTQVNKKIIIQTRSDVDFVYIDVIDNGPGIPEHIQEKVFDPFFTTKDPNKGTGLGLSLCLTYMKEMSGGIDFTTSDAGTKFTLFIPLAVKGALAANG